MQLNKSKKMTGKKAKELSLEVWRYLAEHPEIGCKSELPNYIWREIRNLTGRCPLCELFYGSKNGPCNGCPLDAQNCMKDDSPFDRWLTTEIEEERQGAALEIVKIIEAWEPPEEEE
jgi:hypothetical protein